MPNRLTRMFAGLMSRCSTPEACAAASASASLMPMSRTCPAGIGPFLRSASFSEPAGHSSITRKGRPSLEGARVVDVDDMRMPGQPSRRRHLADEPAAITFGEQHPVIHLHGDLPAHRQLPAPVDGGEAARAEDAADPMSGNVGCRDHDPSA